MNNIIINSICFLPFFIINLIILVKQINFFTESSSENIFKDILQIILIESIFYFNSIIIINMISILDFSNKEITNCLISMHVGMGLSFCIAFVKFLKIYLRR